MICYVAHGYDSEGLQGDGYRVGVQTERSQHLCNQNGYLEYAPEARAVDPHPSKLHHTAYLFLRRIERCGV